MKRVASICVFWLASVAGAQEGAIQRGVIVQPDGLIVTNHHVIAKADQITVVLADRREFDATVVSSPLPAIVDFWAAWCGPCRMIAPHVEALADEFAGRAVVAKLDVDGNRNTAIRFGIQSIPTLLFFRDGKLADRVVGVVDKKTIADKLKALL